MRISIDALSGWQADGFSDKGWFSGEFAASAQLDLWRHLSLENAALPRAKPKSTSSSSPPGTSNSRATMEALHDLRLESRTFVRLPLHRRNGANGMSDIEGKVTRVEASERGQRTSFKIGCCNFCKGLFLKAGSRWVDRKEEAL
jgi:hypothetical protein